MPKTTTKEKKLPKIIFGDIKLDVDGIEYPVTKKGFVDAFKKQKDNKASKGDSDFSFTGNGTHGKDKIKIIKEVLSNAKTDTAAIK